jgi:predicted molibdopterin-dependent oxidoreductase YjgC
MHMPRSICPFCSMGCTWRPGRDPEQSCSGEAGAVTLDYDAEGGPNRGSLCAKGNVSLELMMHPRRLEAPILREGDRARMVEWDEALAFVTGGIERIRSAHGGRAVGMRLGPQLTNEEAEAALRLAGAIGTRSVDLCEPEDHAVLSGIEFSRAGPARVESVEQIDGMNSLLVVGDLLTLAPCAAKPVLNARYRSRRHTLAVLGPTKTRTAWFGRPALQCEPNAEAFALAMMLVIALESTGAPAPAWAESARRTLSRLQDAELERRAGIAVARLAAVVAALRSGPAAGVLLASEFGTTGRMDLVAGLAALLAEAVGARFLAMLEGANSVGIHDLLRRENYPGPSGHTAPEMLEAAVTGDVKALLVFGADPVAAFPGTIASQAMRAVSLAVVTASLPGAAAEAAHVVMPSAVFGEKAGTIHGAFGTPAVLTPAMAPPGRARADRAILDALRAAIPHSPSAPVARAVEGPTDGGFLAELDLFFQSEAREVLSREPGTHLLLAEASSTNAAEGSLTGQLSWARYAYPEPLLGLSTAHAEALGVRAGDRVRVRSNWGQTELKVRIDDGLREGVVTAPHRDPAVRGLLRWRREPPVRTLDLRPDRVSLERVAEARHA